MLGYATQMVGQKDGLSHSWHLYQHIGGSDFADAVSVCVMVWNSVGVLVSTSWINQIGVHLGERKAASKQYRPFSGHVKPQTS